MCRGGTILQQLYQMGKIPAVISGSISEAQLKSGDLCGVGETYCGAFTKYFNALPSLLIKALGYLHVTIPEFCPKGVCKTSGVGESVAASFVGLAAFLYAAL
ncbi:hypothetical protein GNI_034090 [Gregarina niphandrodes]|uniref:Uncharacterized protein n=1 Tax=Gregarina niphandrodes TaxID=110365 RepID=A0A023BAU3_GRENI|nr:hypothetical protein GNI_034090 [Gregarina niphandrodes]EZG78623.1 hypothetical protein GNI_034090 [Gregarina niphandrodes]|eukprot:XP_011129236.1 hypothetical protein GNI_034090 [Gregarina niphandrodes]